MTAAAARPKLHNRGHSLRRFESAAIEPERSMGLRPDHPALHEARTIFPGSVLGTWDSPRFLVSGHNNPKLGKTVLKGPRAGWPIFHVTLEERATCPRSCPVWADCYGNAMPYARRHAVDEDFLPIFQAEVVTLARAHQDGLLVRLHALGDFFSPAYVALWARLIDTLPQLHVFGYTARREDGDDAESRETARAIRELTETNWEQFAIRFSRPEPGPQHSIVVDADPRRPDVIMCPAQTEQTTACATCGLCWAASARDKTVGFLRHGMKRATGPRSTKSERPVVAAPRPQRQVFTPTVVKPTAADRLAAVSEDDRRRIAAAYGAKFPEVRP